MDSEPVRAPLHQRTAHKSPALLGLGTPWGHRQHLEPLEAFLGLLLEILIPWI